MKKFKNKTLMADLALVFITILWGGNFIVVKNALDYMDPIYMTFLRFGLSAISMGLIFFRNMKKMTLKDLKSGSIIGLVMFFAFILQTIGLKYTTPGKQAFIIASNVAMVPFIYWFITKKRPDNYEVMGAILALIGIGIISLNKNFRLEIGDSLTLGATVFFALHIISVGQYAKKSDPIVLTVLQFAIVAILAFLVCIFLKIPFERLDSRMIKSIAYSSVVSTSLCFGIQNVAQKYTSSTHTAIILTLESVFGAFFSIILGQDVLSLRFILGCIVIFSAVIIAETKLSFLKKER